MASASRRFMVTDATCSSWFLMPPGPVIAAYSASGSPIARTLNDVPMVTPSTTGAPSTPGTATLRPVMRVSPMAIASARELRSSLMRSLIAIQSRKPSTSMMIPRPRTAPTPAKALSVSTSCSPSSSWLRPSAAARW